jgi:hypothetical protein
MRFAFVVDPLESLKAYKDSSVAMMRALHDRGGVGVGGRMSDSRSHLDQRP